MDNRASLQLKLCALLGSDNVYFQPPETVKLRYPCIIYEKAKKALSYADNKIYGNVDCYTVTSIYKSIDDDISDTILEAFSMIRHDRTFKNDNLYHDVFQLFY